MAWMWLVAAVGSVASANTCDLSGNSNDAFKVHIRAPNVHVFVEVWTQGAEPTWIDAILGVLARNDVHAVVVVDPVDPVPHVIRATQALDVASRTVAIHLPSRMFGGGATIDAPALRKTLRPVHAAFGRTRAVYAPTGTRSSEAPLGRLGFRSLFDTAGPPTAVPRLAAHLEGQRATNVVFHAGPYVGACGSEPRIGPFTPKTADRAALAIQRSTPDQSAAFVRVGLDGRRGTADDAEVLERWLQTVLIPGQVSLPTVDEARQAALSSFRRGGGVANPRERGRLVTYDDIERAAHALTTATTIPRSLDGRLNPTQAFVAFVHALSRGNGEQTPIVLARVEGPTHAVPTSLPGPTAVPRAALVDVARSLARVMPQQLPGALSVDGQLVTASELLVGFADAFLGREPVRLRPVDSPDPHAAGLGWGVSE